jgi:hypothetical protein
LRSKLFLSGLVLFVLLCFSLFLWVGASSMWSQTYGDAWSDYAYSLIVTPDGGYALAGSTESSIYGPSDMWLVKTDASGNMMWNKTYGGTGNEGANSLVATSDGGYALAGNTHDRDADFSDFWLVKTDAQGNMEWNQTYGGTGVDSASSLIATSDGGYAIAGTWNNSGGSDPNHADFWHGDFWLVKTDAFGNMEWNQTYGGTENEEAYALVATSDGGYALAGSMGFYYYYTGGNLDFWLVKTDSLGNMQWNQTYGGESVDEAYSLVATSDGGYALAGMGHLSPAIMTHTTVCDFWLVKTDENGVVPEYTSWVAPLLVLAAAAPILFYRKRLLRKCS